MGEIVFEDEKILLYKKEPGEDSEKIFPELYVTSRLDKPVGGLLLFAKDSKTAALCSDKENVDKTYYALVKGELEPEGVMEDLLLHDRRANKAYVVKRSRKGVKPARLSYESVESIKTSDEVFSLVKIRLDTGRSHQIRVQFSSRRHPLAGDGKYGSRVKGYIRLFCKVVDVRIYGRKEERHFEVPLPDDFFDISL